MRIIERERERAKEAELANLSAETRLARTVDVSPAVVRVLAENLRAKLDSEDTTLLKEVLHAFIVRVEITRDAGTA